MHCSKKVLAIAAVVAMGAISACSTAAGDKASPVAEGRKIVDKSIWPKERPERGLAKGMVLPLEAYMMSYAGSVEVEKGQNALKNQCMAEYDLKVDFPLPGANPPPSNNDANIKRRYGITDRAEAAKYGYGLPPELTRHTDQPADELSDVETEVLTGRGKEKKAEQPEGVKEGEPYFGLPSYEKARAEHNGVKLKDGGCAKWSEDKLGWSEHQKDTFLVSDLNGDSLVATQKSKPVQAAFKDWSACMAKAGYKGLENPYKAMDKAEFGKDGKATKGSIAMAVADIDCKGSTNLVKIWFEEESKFQKQQIKDNKAKLDSVKSAHKKLMDTASAAAKK